MGPRTDPWGTPYLIVTVLEFSLLKYTVCTRSLKYDLNQSRALPDRPRYLFKRSSRISGSKVSKAAERSKFKRIEQLLLSAARRRSFDTFNNAVTVLWSDLYPDCKISSTLHNTICSRILLATIFSKIFDKKGNKFQGWSG